MSRSPKKPTGAYVVGYRHPPLHSRFRRGNSGNPRGRPRGRTAEKVRGLMQDELFRTISIRDGDQVLRLPAIRAVLRQTILLALKGNSPAQRRVIDIIQAIARQGSDGSSESDGGAMTLETLIAESMEGTKGNG